MIERAKLVDEARRVCEDATYSAKGHFNAAARWTQIHYGIGIPTAVMSAVAGVSALSEFDNHSAVAGSLAIFVAALTGVTTFLKPSERASKHLAFGNRFNSLKNRARVAAELDAQSLAPEDFRELLTELGSERDELNAAAPAIPRVAFKRAQTGITEGQATYEVDDKD